MREIKFRAWDANSGHMSYSQTEQFDDMLGFRFENFHIDTEKPVYMQFTGLYDKNGKEIYEGDIVKFLPPFAPPFTSEVFLEVGCFFIYNNKRNTAKTTNNTMQDISIPIYQLACSFEVIGNIYENPELLEASHDT
jgi:uncharacterized phage protein (TIGR01671 family)